MSRFAERNPKLWAFLEQVSALILGGLGFWLSLAAVVTAPAALAGLFAVAGLLVRGGEEDWFALFLRTARSVFGRALLLGLADLLVGVILFLDIRFLWALGHPLGKAAAFLMGSIAALVVLVNTYAWPLLAWYPQPLGALLKRAFLLAAAHPISAIGGWLGVGGMIGLMALLPGRLLFVLPLFGPGLAVLILSAAAWSSMRRYDTQAAKSQS